MKICGMRFGGMWHAKDSGHSGMFVEIGWGGRPTMPETAWEVFWADFRPAETFCWRREPATQQYVQKSATNILGLR
jgi:hypothetical protein